MVRRVFNAAAACSTVLLGCALVALLLGYFTDPWKSALSLRKDFHIGVWNMHGLDSRLVFFNDRQYGPYRGSIIALTVNGESPKSIIQSEWGDSAGIYYRYFHWTDSGNTLWTLMISLWYFIAAFSILPTVWLLVRRRNQKIAGAAARLAIAAGPSRWHQVVLIGSVFLGSWLAMQAVHESGHVLGAWLTGGRVARVVLWPFTISRTDLAENPHPLFVVWAGPVFGVVAPLSLWVLAAGVGLRGAFVLRFFAGFCLLANGLYIGIGSFGRIGDCGVMLRHGSALWQLWLFGSITVPAGLWLWHGQGRWFGLGAAKGTVDVVVAYWSLLACLGLIALGVMVGGR